MSSPVQISDILTVETKQAMNPMFVSIGYDKIRIGKKLSEKDVAYLVSMCDFYDDKYHFRANTEIKFHIHGTLVILSVCPAKFLRSGNVILATPDEMRTTLNRVEKETGFSFWGCVVYGLHFTITIQTPEPFNNYRTLFKKPSGYEHGEKQKLKDGEYFNGDRAAMFFYNKTAQCKGKFTVAEISAFNGTFMPELFRAEIRIEKGIRKVLVSSGFWDKKKTQFLSEDLTSEETFRSLALYADRFIKRFIPKMRTKKESKGAYKLLRIVSSQDSGMQFIENLFHIGEMGKRTYDIATKYHNEAKEQERSEYIRKQITDKVASVVEEYEEHKRLTLQAKKTVQRLKSNIITIAPNQHSRALINA